MSREVDALIREFREIADHPAQAMRRFREETGQEAVGCFPVYTPEPIVHAAGMLPVGMWGAQVELAKVRAVLPSFACSIMQSIMELQMTGVYDDLAAVIVPSLCDTLKDIGQKWSGKVPCLQFVHPQNRLLPAAATFLAGEYQHIRERLEAITGKTITDEAIAESMEIYNAHNRVMREFSQLAARHPDAVTPAARHAVMKSAFFVRKERHTAMVKELLEALRQLPEPQFDGKRVVLTGIMAEPAEVLDILQGQNFCVVADDLAQESRQYRVDYPGGDSAPLERMAAAWQMMEGCSLACDPRKNRVNMLRRMVEENHADGLVVCMMKFCDPEEFDYPLIKAAMEKAGIPCLYLDIDQQLTSFEQTKTRVQVFAEMLNG